MTDFRTANSIGARIAAIRRMRGMKNSKELADAVPNDSVTESIIQNIEAGRKADLAVSQLLNIAWALRVPPIFLLAPLGIPDAPLDLPNLTDEVRELGAEKLDAWLSANYGATYGPRLHEEDGDLRLLDAFRKLRAEQRTLHRLERVRQLEAEWPTPLAKDEVPREEWDDYEQRTEQSRRRIEQLKKYLSSGGWPTE